MLQNFVGQMASRHDGRGLGLWAKEGSFSWLGSLEYTCIETFFPVWLEG